MDKLIYILLWLPRYLKIIKKPTQIYYTNSINGIVQGAHNKHNAGAGFIYVMSNSYQRLNELRMRINISEIHWYNIHGYPALKVLGSKIGLIKRESKYNNLPKDVIIKELKSQKSDKVNVVKWN